MTCTYHVCESCQRRTELRYVRRVDEYLCEDCEASAVEEIHVPETDGTWDDARYYNC